MGFNPLGTGVIFDIKWFNEAQYYFAKRSINQDWDKFKTAIYEYLTKQIDEVLNSTCKAPYPVVDTTVSTAKGKIYIYLDLSDVPFAEKDEAIRKINEFGHIFEDMIDLSAFAVPEVDDGVAFIDGEIFVKYSARDAQLSKFFLMYDADNTETEILSNWERG